MNFNVFGNKDEANFELIKKIHKEAKTKYPTNKTLQAYHEYAKWIQCEMTITTSLVKNMPNPPECLLQVIHHNYATVLNWSKETRLDTITGLLCQNLPACVAAACTKNASTQIKEMTLKRLEMHLIQSEEEKEDNQNNSVNLEEVASSLEEIINKIIAQCEDKLDPSQYLELREVSKRTMISTSRLLYSVSSIDKPIRDLTPNIMTGLKSDLRLCMKYLEESTKRDKENEVKPSFFVDDENLDYLITQIEQITTS